MSINLDKGVWTCHAGCGAGGVLAFEQKLSNCDKATAAANIAELTGTEQRSMFAEKPEAVYPYHDAHGRLVFEKLRYPGKRFVQRRPNGNGGYEYKLGDCKKPLYQLPDVLTSNQIFICEGEKDADNVRKLEWGEHRVTATTNFDGAGKWRDEYAVYFAGKRVVILPDNDEPGRRHAEAVARSIYRFASGIRIVQLPDLPEKGDVSDYLKVHSKDDLLAQITRAPQWFPPEAEQNSILVAADQFVAATPVDTDWMVQGVIERGANGFFCAAPKGGKSWAAIDLCLSLALGVPWLGFAVPRPFRVALVSREDNPSLTGWRMRNLQAGKTGDHSLIAQNLYVNTRSQSAEFLLDNREQWQELVDALKERQIEFVVFDVFNVCHGADENDNTQMRGILRQLSAIQTAVGCGIGVIHHYSKAETGSMVQRLRGASAISGWAEWLIGISMADEELKLRRMDFECKAACPPDPIHYRIKSALDGSVRLEREQSAPQLTAPRRREGSAAERFMN